MCEETLSDVVTEQQRNRPRRLRANDVDVDVDKLSVEQTPQLLCMTTIDD